MSEFIRIPDEDIDMSWTDPNGEVHKHFDDDAALAALLLAEVVFLNSRWWRDHDKDHISVSVNCNDVFAWACADGEDLPFDQIENLWRMWRKDEAWGAAVWCMQRRNQMPQKPVEKRIRESGIWDLDAMNLPANTQDAEAHALFAEHARAHAQAKA